MSAKNDGKKKFDDLNIDSLVKPQDMASLGQLPGVSVRGLLSQLPGSSSTSPQKGKQMEEGKLLEKSEIPSSRLTLRLFQKQSEAGVDDKKPSTLSAVLSGSSSLECSEEKDEAMEEGGKVGGEERGELRGGESECGLTVSIKLGGNEEEGDVEEKITSEGREVGDLSEREGSESVPGDLRDGGMAILESDPAMGTASTGIECQLDMASTPDRLSPQTDSPDQDSQASRELVTPVASSDSRDTGQQMILPHQFHANQLNSHSSSTHHYSSSLPPSSTNLRHSQTPDNSSLVPFSQPPSSGATEFSQTSSTPPIFLPSSQPPPSSCAASFYSTLPLENTTCPTHEISSTVAPFDPSSLCSSQAESNASHLESTILPLSPTLLHPEAGTSCQVDENGTDNLLSLDHLLSELCSSVGMEVDGSVHDVLPLSAGESSQMVCAAVDAPSSFSLPQTNNVSDWFQNETQGTEVLMQQNGTGHFNGDGTTGEGGVALMTSSAHIPFSPKLPSEIQNGDENIDSTPKLHPLPAICPPLTAYDHSTSVSASVEALLSHPPLATTTLTEDSNTLLTTDILTTFDLSPKVSIPDVSTVSELRSASDDSSFPISELSSLSPDSHLPESSSLYRSPLRNLSASVPIPSVLRQARTPQFGDVPIKECRIELKPIGREWTPRKRHFSECDATQRERELRCVGVKPLPFPPKKLKFSELPAEGGDDEPTLGELSDQVHDIQPSDQLHVECAPVQLEIVDHEIVQPSLSNPEVGCPDIPTDPEVGCPDIPTDPEVGCPNIPTDPEVGCPDIPTDPEVSCPDIPTDPEIGCPDIPTDPEVGCSDIPTDPEVGCPDITDAEVGGPNIPTTTPHRHPSPEAPSSPIPSTTSEVTPVLPPTTNPQIVTPDTSDPVSATHPHQSVTEDAISHSSPSESQANTSKAPDVVQPASTVNELPADLREEMEKQGAPTDSHEMLKVSAKEPVHTSETVGEGEEINSEVGGVIHNQVPPPTVCEVEGAEEKCDDIEATPQHGVMHEELQEQSHTQESQIDLSSLGPEEAHTDLPTVTSVETQTTVSSAQINDVSQTAGPEEVGGVCVRSVATSTNGGSEVIERETEEDEKTAEKEEDNLCEKAISSERDENKPESLDEGSQPDCSPVEEFGLLHILAQVAAEASPKVDVMASDDPALTEDKGDPLQADVIGDKCVKISDDKTGGVYSQPSGSISRLEKGFVSEENASERMAVISTRHRRGGRRIRVWGRKVGNKRPAVENTVRRKVGGRGCVSLVASTEESCIVDVMGIAENKSSGEECVREGGSGVEEEQREIEESEGRREEDNLNGEESEQKDGVNKEGSVESKDPSPLVDSPSKSTDDAAQDLKSCDNVDIKTCDDDMKSCDDDMKSCDDDTKSCDDDTKSCDNDTKSCDDDVKSCDTGKLSGDEGKLYTELDVPGPPPEKKVKSSLGRWRGGRRRRGRGRGRSYEGRRKAKRKMQASLSEAEREVCAGMEPNGMDSELQTDVNSDDKEVTTLDTGNGDSKTGQSTTAMASPTMASLSHDMTSSPCTMTSPPHPIPTKHNSFQTQSTASPSKPGSVSLSLPVCIPLSKVEVIHYQSFQCYSTSQFQSGDVVWAKAAQLPGWPGVVINHKEWKRNKLKAAPVGKVSDHYRH